MGRNKSGLVTFRSPKKQIYKNLNFRLSGQKSNQNVTHSSWESFNEYMNTLKKKKKNIANGILAKLRYYVSANILETIFNAFIATHMRYACQICSQSHSKTSNMTQNV